MAFAADEETTDPIRDGVIPRHSFHNKGSGPREFTELICRIGICGVKRSDSVCSTIPYYLMAAIGKII